MTVCTVTFGQIGRPCHLE